MLAPSVFITAVARAAKPGETSTFKHTDGTEYKKLLKWDHYDEILLNLNRNTGFYLSTSLINEKPHLILCYEVKARSNFEWTTKERNQILLLVNSFFNRSSDFESENEEVLHTQNKLSIHDFYERLRQAHEHENFDGIPTNVQHRSLRSVRVDTESDKFRMKIWFPELVMQGTYQLKGQLLMMPINGQGDCFGNFSDIDGVLSMKLKRYEKNNDEHFKVDFMQIEFNIGAAKVQLANLFENGDEELSKSMNHFINENWRMVTAESRPTLEKTISEILLEVANSFFEAYPIKKLFIS